MPEGEGAAADDFWGAATAVADLESAWRRLRVQRNLEVANADSALTVQAAGINMEGLDGAASQASTHAAVAFSSSKFLSWAF